MAVAARLAAGVAPARPPSPAVAAAAVGGGVGARLVVFAASLSTAVAAAPPFRFPTDVAEHSYDLLADLVRPPQTNDTPVGDPRLAAPAAGAASDTLLHASIEPASNR